MSESQQLVMTLADSLEDSVAMLVEDNKIIPCDIKITSHAVWFTDEQTGKEFALFLEMLPEELTNPE